MISVGVGNINQDEIEAVATEPNCTHVYILNNFREIDALLYQLKDTSCSGMFLYCSYSGMFPYCSRDQWSLIVRIMATEFRSEAVRHGL